MHHKRLVSLNSGGEISGVWGDCCIPSLGSFSFAAALENCLRLCLVENKWNILNEYARQGLAKFDLALSVIIPGTSTGVSR